MSVTLRMMLNNVLMKMLKLTFEMVSPMTAGARGFYCGCGEHPATDPATIPDEFWHTVRPVSEIGAEGRERVMSQYAGLIQQMGEGELIRNVRLWEAEEPEWTEVTPVFPS